MTKDGDPKDTEAVDPGNGLPIAWQYGKRGRDLYFSLVQVSRQEPFQIVFENSERQFLMTFSPSAPDENDLWKVYGIGDADIVSQLGLPVTTHRQRDAGPTINDSDLTEAQGQYGDTAISRLGTSHYSLDIPNYPVSLVEQFLNTVWTPKNRGEVIRNHPSINLTGDSGAFVLPQKIPSPRTTSQTILKVERLPSRGK